MEEEVSRRRKLGIILLGTLGPWISLFLILVLFQWLMVWISLAYMVTVFSQNGGEFEITQ